MSETTPKIFSFSPLHLGQVTILLQTYRGHLDLLRRSNGPRPSVIIILPCSSKALTRLLGISFRQSTVRELENIPILEIANVAYRRRQRWDWAAIFLLVGPVLHFKSQLLACLLPMAQPGGFTRIHLSLFQHHQPGSKLVKLKFVKLHFVKLHFVKLKFVDGLYIIDFHVSPKGLRQCPYISRQSQL